MFVLNIDPDAAAQGYRARVVEQMGSQARPQDISTVQEQLSGACTTEIATFDEFANLLSRGGADYDHVVFDTAPTYAATGSVNSSPNLRTASAA
jgi:arsenite/tail-anchored protein-transporting ATPase